MDGQDFHRLRFYQEQLFEAKDKLFNAKNVKQLKFLQDRIHFLMKQIDTIQTHRAR